METNQVKKHQFGDATRFQSVEVDDLVSFADRYWIITGVHIGATGQESVATIAALDKSNASVHGREVRESIVPLPFLYGRIYRYVPPGDSVARERGQA